MCRQHFYVIGLSDDHTCYFNPEVSKIIREGRVFSGGVRHREIVAHLLPEGAKWIDITIPLDNVFSEYDNIPEIIVFASGDPLFFGFANTIRKRLPHSELTLFPSFNSLQMLAHRILLPYHDMKTVSLTGRKWDEFDCSLIKGEKIIGVLTDHHKTPSSIASRMLQYGYDNYKMTVGEMLGNRDRERIHTIPLSEAVNREFTSPNCIILEKTFERERPFGISETEFHLLNGRANMITKAPIRLITLSMLDLHNRQSLWDIGFCTGSVSIEAKLQFPHLHVTSFEQREEGRELMEVNSRKFGTPGITTSIGDFLRTDISNYPAPDAVFIGGHGGRMVDILKKIKQVISPNGVIVFNAVSDNSRELFLEGINEINFTLTKQLHIVIDSFNPIDIMKAE